MRNFVMAINEKADTILATAEEIAEALNAFITPINDGDKNINDEATTDAMVDRWDGIRSEVTNALEELEIAWAFQEDPSDDEESSESEE